MTQMPAPAGPPPRRRFVPVPIETTFERYRKTVPASGPTPSPSPPLTPAPPVPSLRATSPPQRLWVNEMAQERARDREKKRFAPQLIESSRRSRRVGDVGPATKPADKTDITPYHNHIYALKTRKKHRKVQSLARRESCDDETANSFFETLVRENEKRILEDALAAFPNSRARAGGAEHFAIREGSDDDSSSSSSIQSRRVTGPHQYRTARRTRRDSLTEDVGWALREMQEHHDHLTKVRAASVASDHSPYGTTLKTTAPDDTARPAETASPAIPASRQTERISTLDLDNMSIDSPPVDPIWTTAPRCPTLDSPLHAMGEITMPYIPEEQLDIPGIAEGYHGIPAYARKLREAEGDIEDDDHGSDHDQSPVVRQHIPPSPGPIGEALMPYIPAAPPGKAADMPYVAPPAVKVLAESDFRGRAPFTGGYRNKDLFAERELHKLRKQSPPMLGKDLVFPKCLSPKQTALEPQYLWSMSGFRGESHRDATGKNGLWNGYCYSREKNEALAPIERLVLLETPFPPSSPCDPFDHAFSASAPVSICEEPLRTEVSATGASGADDATGLSPQSAVTRLMAPGTMSVGSGSLKLELDQHRARQLQKYHAASKAVPLLMGLDERLQQEKTAADLEEKIATEFTDRFVTQVYNYLSLGYPAMARAYDDEFSKISRIPVSELERDDATAEDGFGNVTGHIVLDDDCDGPSPKSPRNTNYNDCPRWRALKLYIYEWARQHPDLDSISPLAWGVRERRGSWGV